MLVASGEVVYVNEPMNPGHPPGRSPGVLDAVVTHQFQYLPTGTDADQQWRHAFADTMALRYRLRAELRRNHGGYDLARAAKYATAFTVGRARGRRAMLDDPFALLSTAWLVKEFGCSAVVLVRDPVSMVGSWRRLGWQMHFHELLEQPKLHEDHLGAYAERMRALIGSPDWLARSCLLWEAAHDVVLRTVEGLSGVQVIRYEDLVRQPIPRFASLYASLGLTWTEDSRRQVQRATTASTGSAEAAHTWSLRGGLSRTAYRPMDASSALGSYAQRLTAVEIERVHELTAGVRERVDAATTT